MEVVACVVDLAIHQALIAAPFDLLLQTPAPYRAYHTSGDASFETLGMELAFAAISISGAGADLV